MIPNLKVDIIYYNTQSDFEMEFNLSGYCRMRIFKSSASTPEELINTLATDLDRSQIIMVVSNVFGKDCGVTTVSDAVGFELISADKEEFKINSDEEVFIPKNAVPLVSKSGSYGGCILESGDQSIIMITDNRALRHEIMKSLVHQYIFDISQLDAYKRRKQFDGVKAEESVQNITEGDTQTDETSKTGFSVPNPNFESGINNSIFSTPGTNLVINPNKEKEEPSEETENPIAMSEELESKKKSKKTSDVILLIIVILLLIAFGIMAYFFIYIPLTNGSLSLTDSNSGIIKAIETWLLN